MVVDLTYEDTRLFSSRPSFDVSTKEQNYFIEKKKNKGEKSIINFI